jgi:5-methyltetrahydropteroyltriglutamate--homocysteine methyltransferase
MPIITSNLGFPRIGPRRELKTALERFWSGNSTVESLLNDAAALRAATWARQHGAGVMHIPSNDFSLYDHVLDTSAMVGAVPDVYGWTGGDVSVDTYFAMARGTQTAPGNDTCAGHGVHGQGLPPLEMTKWFDTNYHYMVPEFVPGQRFTLASTKPIDEFLEAKSLGYHTRPVLLGPVTYLLLGKGPDRTFDLLSLLPRLLPVYQEVLRRLSAAGADWVQIDEPALVLDLDDRTRSAFGAAYSILGHAAPTIKILLTTYFGALGENLDTALSLPIAGIHVDLARSWDQIDPLLAKAPANLVLSLGVIDGRNIWRADLTALLNKIEPIVDVRDAGKLILAPSCSLLHVPVDLTREIDLDPEIKNWLSFAIQKLNELDVLRDAIDNGREAVAAALAASEEAAMSRKTSPRIHNPAVQTRMAAIAPEMSRRSSTFSKRRELQQRRLRLPPFPTTTIGSFPQTAEVRKARAAHTKGSLDQAAYTEFLRRETETAVRWQEEIGLDVLVHGEFERNDMVQYFGEQLSGYAFIKHGWVQSYGSRYVRPPIIFGDVSRPKPMTVEWSSYAQSLTGKPMKGMLTGPVTMLQWSFVRDDQPREQTCRQIALALRDEVADLENAGIGIIQIDEPAVREGLPLRKAEWQDYLHWAVDCFRLTSCGVADATQIHTHMCYSEFNDIIASIGAMDADVISIETARSRMGLLEAFTAYRYPNEIGPGVYDIHAPRVPSTGEMAEMLAKASDRLATDQIWVNPDCGLKTRRWEEVRPALVNMIEAARRARSVTSG